MIQNEAFVVVLFPLASIIATNTTPHCTSRVYIFCERAPISLRHPFIPEQSHRRADSQAKMDAPETPLTPRICGTLWQTLWWKLPPPLRKSIMRYSMDIDGCGRFLDTSLHMSGFSIPPWAHVNRKSRRLYFEWTETEPPTVGSTFLEETADGGIEGECFPSVEVGGMDSDEPLAGGMDKGSQCSSTG